MRKYTTKNIKIGFTLIETMVAISILALSIAGPLYTAGRALVATESSRDQITASYLAQEGVEYIRAMRDDAYLAERRIGGQNVSSISWDNFTKSTKNTSILRCSTAPCTVDPFKSMGTGNGLSLEQCIGKCAPLFLSNGRYTQQSGIAGAVRTPFTRSVKITAISFNEESVVSTVSWKFHNTPYTTSVVVHLTKWQ